MRRLNGLVLPEVIVALSLGAMLVVSTAGWPLLLNQLSGTTQAATELVANAALAERILRLHVHKAGYAGCLSDKSTALLQPKIAIYATTGPDIPPVAATALRKTLPGSQVLFVQYAQPPGWSITDDIGLAEPGWHILHLSQAAPRLRTGQELWLTDCRQLIAAVIEDIGLFGETLTVRIAPGQVPADDFIARTAFVPVRQAFFLRDSGRKMADGEPLHSLYAQGESSASSELVPGLNRWQLVLADKLLSAELHLASTASVPGRLAGRIHRTFQLLIAIYNA